MGDRVHDHRNNIPTACRSIIVVKYVESCVIDQNLIIKDELMIESVCQDYTKSCNGVEIKSVTFMVESIVIGRKAYLLPTTLC